MYVYALYKLVFESLRGLKEKRVQANEEVYCWLAASINADRKRVERIDARLQCFRAS